MDRRPAGDAIADDPRGLGVDAGRDCPLCPRLVAFRAAARVAEPHWHNAPVASFGSLDARLLVVGLAPGLRGANRTGRPFTGDFAGDLLYETLTEFGFTIGTYAQRADDGLKLADCLITNAVRCVPPENKPTPLEIRTCRMFLEATLAAMANVRAIVALGRVAHDSVVRAIGQTPARLPFGHGREFALPFHRPHPEERAKLASRRTRTMAGASASANPTGTVPSSFETALSGPPQDEGMVRPIAPPHGLVLFDSYHCSRYNTNTGVLTPRMFRAVFARVRQTLAAAGPPSPADLGSA